MMRWMMAGALCLLILVSGVTAGGMTMGTAVPATTGTDTKDMTLRMLEPDARGCDQEPQVRIGDATGMAAQAVTGTPAPGTDSQQPVPIFEPCFNQIRPGARMTSPAGCTFNFVFRQGGDLFIGTAAHCTSSVGQRVSMSGPPGNFGEVVFRGWDGAPNAISNDFALIRIDTNKHSHVDPGVCTWGGPTGVGHPGSLLQEDLLLQYGWGIASQFTPQTRSRIHDEFLSTTDLIRWNGIGSGGDSGSPMLLDDGRAAGIHTAGITPVAGVFMETGPSMQRIMQMTSNAGYNLQLETAPMQWSSPL